MEIKCKITETKIPVFKIVICYGITKEKKENMAFGVSSWAE